MKKKVREANAGGVIGASAPLGDEDMVKEFIKDKIREVVRKKKGGTGYILYKPNNGKKKKPVAVGEFPTKALAKQAELARFPPKDPNKLKNARKGLARLKAKHKRESLDRISDKLFEAAADAMDDVENDEVDSTENDVVNEPVDKLKSKPKAAPSVPPSVGPAEPEDALPSTPVPNDTDNVATKKDVGRTEESRWEKLLSSVSQEAVKKDSRLRSINQKIDNQSMKSLEKAVKDLSRKLPYTVSKGKTGRDKLDRQYITCTIQTDSGKVGPVYLFMKGELLHVVADGAVKSDIMKLDPDDASEIKSALTKLSSDFDGSKVKDAIEVRDEYLASIEYDVDDYLSDLGPLELTILKKLIVDKYSGDKK